MKTVLITGGCSGIGFALACRFAMQNFRIVLVSNREKELTESALFIEEQYKTSCRYICLDLATSDGASKLIKICEAEGIEPDVAVINAGIFFFGEIAETSDKKASDMIFLHNYTPAMLCIYFGKKMKMKRAGDILIISSLASKMPYPGIGFYSATKAFISSLARSLHSEMKAYQVNVSCILPGAVATNLYHLDNAYKKQALNWGIMMKPDKLARKAIKAMHRKKAIYIPGFFNKLSVFFLLLVPHWFIRYIRQKSSILPPDK